MAKSEPKIAQKFPEGSMYITPEWGGSPFFLGSIVFHSAQKIPKFVLSKNPIFIFLKIAPAPEVYTIMGLFYDIFVFVNSSSRPMCVGKK